jgi:chromosome segregation ATPase
MKFQRSLKLIVGTILLTTMCYAEDDIEDIETEMDTAFSDSDAARSEAEAARIRKAEEKAKLERAKQDARTQVQKAQSTEAQARQKIAVLEGESNALRKQREGYELQIKKALAQIKLSEEKVAKATQIRDKLLAERNAAKDEQDKQHELLTAKRDEIARIDKEIKDERQALNDAAVKLKELKAQNAATAVELKRRQVEGEKEKKRISREKASYDKLIEKETPRRFKTIALRQDCNLHQDAALSSRVLDRVKKSSRVSVAKFNGEGWFRVDGDIPGFMHKTCK